MGSIPVAPATQDYLFFMIWLPIIGNYTEIDAYASAIAYAELLNQRGKPAKVYLKHTPNYSVPDVLRIKAAEQYTFDFQLDDQAIILDISIPEVIHQAVTDGQILELIDHHPGNEQYWQQTLGKRAIIEPIGAVATSIFEWWGKCWDYAKMSPEIAKLLLAAVLDNTLDFNANITTDRDHAAADKLAEIANTTVKDFAEWYFSTVSQTVLTNLEASLLSDIKIMALPSDASEFAFGQLTSWDSKAVLAKTAEVQAIMGKAHQNWLLSVLSLSDKRNYILTNSNALAKYFTKLLDLHTHGDVYTTDRLLLRKEILKRMLQDGK